MNDLMETIQKVMSDPESVKQLSSLAQSLGLDTSQAPTPTPPPQQSQSVDFSKLFQNLQGASTAQQAQQSQGNTADFAKLMELSKILETASKTDKNTELILALKPHLRAETQQKADRLVKIFKLLAIYPALKESGLLGGDLLGIL